MEMRARGSFIKMFTPQLLLPSAQKLMASNNAIPPNFGGSSPHVLSRCVYDICVCLIRKPVSVWRLLGGRGWGKSVRFVDSVPLSSPKTIFPNMLTNVLLPGNCLRNSKTHQAFFNSRLEAGVLFPCLVFFYWFIFALDTIPVPRKCCFGCFCL